MMRLLDTDILVDILRGTSGAVDWFESLEETAGVPGFAAMELIQGCRNARDVAVVEKLLASFDILWPSAKHAEEIRLRFPALYLQHGVGVLDALIAACAIGRAAILCTFNVKHYRAFSGLQIETPYKR